MATENRSKRIGQSIGFMFSHPFEAMVGVFRQREEYMARMAQADEKSYAPLTKAGFLDALGTDDIPTVGTCSYLGGGSTVPDFALLRGLCERCAREHGGGYKVDYLEIGTWRGESIVNVMDSDSVASALSITLDGSEFGEKVAANVNFFITDKYSDKFSQIFANSATFDFGSLDRKFDVIFIDGDHSYEGILSDSRNAFGLLKDDKSIVVWHDYGVTPEEVCFTTLKAIRDGVPADKQDRLYAVGNTLCAVYMNNELAAEESDVPTISYEVSMRAKRVGGEIVVAATTNAHKIREIGEITKPFGMRLVSRHDAGVPDVEIVEDGKTFEENSYKKAYEVMKLCGKPTIADDSGLSVDALDGAPGIYSARFSGVGGEESDEANNDKLLELLDGVPWEKRTARYVCVITMIFPDGETIVARGECEGHITTERHGTGGFGYDPIFVPEGYERTFGEFTAEDKNAISHRGKALIELERKLLCRKNESGAWQC